LDKLCASLILPKSSAFTQAAFTSDSNDRFETERCRSRDSFIFTPGFSLFLNSVAPATELPPCKASGEVITLHSGC
jgi:hypothetical protein